MTTLERSLAKARALEERAVAVQEFAATTDSSYWVGVAELWTRAALAWIRAGIESTPPEQPYCFQRSLTCVRRCAAACDRWADAMDHLARGPYVTQPEGDA